MSALTEKNISCPYCGELISVLIDCSVAQQEYIEDCQVCCRPILFKVEVSSNGEALVLAHHEDE